VASRRHYPCGLAFIYTQSEGIHYVLGERFFTSLVHHWPRRDVAALLTGMGRDGAQGLAALRKAGWHTIAQDEKSSVVYGMPAAAAELDAAIEILPLKEIAGAVRQRIAPNTHNTKPSRKDPKS
jgi:chemotaxis response regulator CheB